MSTLVDKAGKILPRGCRTARPHRSRILFHLLSPVQIDVPQIAQAAHLIYSGQVNLFVTQAINPNRAQSQLAALFKRSRISTDLIYLGEPSSVLDASNDAYGAASKLIVGQRAAHILHILSALHECRRNKVQAVLCSKVLQVLNAGPFQRWGGDGCVWQADVHALLQAAGMLDEHGPAGLKEYKGQAFVETDAECGRHQADV